VAVSLRGVVRQRVIASSTAAFSELFIFGKDCQLLAERRLATVFAGLDAGGLGPERFRLEGVSGGCGSEARQDAGCAIVGRGRGRTARAWIVARGHAFSAEKIVAIDYKNIAQLRLSSQPKDAQDLGSAVRADD
jgi:hypothetical protein